MSGSAEGAGPGAGGRPGRRRGIWVGLVIGVVAVSGAVAAVLYGGGGEEGADGREPTPRQPDGPVEVVHTFPATYAGQVWITITAADDAPRSVTIRWGPWERRLVHESTEPVSYWFTKNAPRPGDQNVPTTVRIDPSADVTFDQGTPPVGAVDASEDWEAATDAADDGGA